LKLLESYIDELIGGFAAAKLFPEMPTINFYPETDSCPDCGLKLQVQKTRTKNISTLGIGSFIAKETVLQCPQDGEVLVSEELRSLAPEKCTFGFDVIVHIGEELFIKCKSHEEIMSDLAAKNISISEREISFLAKKFVVYLALAHRQSVERLRKSMEERGGYVLHIDGTCEGDSPNLFVGLDGISELVLDCVKLPSENKDQIIPFLKGIKEQFGVPLAQVHDMGKGILSGVEEVFPGNRDFICHFHFLRDIGKDMLGKEYDLMNSLLRKHKVKSSLRQKARYLKDKIGDDSQAVNHLCSRLDENKKEIEIPADLSYAAAYSLIHWALAKPQNSGGYGFPFDRPHLEFYNRLIQLHRLLGRLISDQNQVNARPFMQLWKLLDKVMKDKELLEASIYLDIKAEVFDKLRQALRIALPEGNLGLNDDGGEEDIITIEKRATEFREWLTEDLGRKKLYSKMIEQLDKYWGKLFADPITVQTAHGEVVIQPQRTNNILERFFRGEKRRGRKRSGSASLSKELKAILAETPLVRNLENDQYLKIVLNGCDTLAERFSQIDAELVREQLKLARSDQDKLEPRVKKLIAQPDLPEKIVELFGDSNFNANRHLRL